MQTYPSISLGEQLARLWVVANSRGERKINVRVYWPCIIGCKKLLIRKQHCISSSIMQLSVDYVMITLNSCLPFHVQFLRPLSLSPRNEPSREERILTSIQTVGKGGVVPSDTFYAFAAEKCLDTENSLAAAVKRKSKYTKYEDEPPGPYLSSVIKVLPRTDDALKEDSYSRPPNHSLDCPKTPFKFYNKSTRWLHDPRATWTWKLDLRGLHPSLPAPEPTSKTLE